MTAIEGVDYAFPPIPSAAALVAAGKHFACRYGGPGSDSKQLHAAELAALTAAGIAVVANAEGTTDGLKGGYAAGRSWAADAEQHFRALGMPGDRPIYLSVDFDANSTHWPALDAAMDGAASVLGRERVGVYGSYRVVEHFAANGKARWFWQTYAWSGGAWSPAAHIQQYNNGEPLGGVTVDLNRAMRADYGQWGVEDMSQADVITGESALWDKAANRSDPTGRNFANDVYAVISAALGDEFGTVGQAIAQGFAQMAGAISALQSELDEVKAKLPGSSVPGTQPLFISGTVSGTVSGSITGSATPGAA